MTLEQFIAATAATLLSLLLSYGPGISDWWNTKDTVFKSFVSAILIVIVGVAALLWKCDFTAACLQVDWKVYAQSIFYALVANQSTYVLSPKKALIKAKFAQKG